MMNRRHGQLAILMVSTILLSGCAATGAAQPPASTTEQSSSSKPTASGPSEAARMICGAETDTNITRALALSDAPHGVDSWKDHLYTCTYQLESGAFVLSVKESANTDTAGKYFLALRKTLGSTTPIDGLANLGFPAYKSSGGVVVFVKDSMTLKVDASQLATTVGPHQVSRSDFAYEIATAILGCWTG